MPQAVNPDILQGGQAFLGATSSTVYPQPTQAGGGIRPVMTSDLVRDGVGFLTVGNVVQSGCDFDPGNYHTPGDQVGNDATLAWTAGNVAATSPPYSVNRPCKLVFRGGVYNAWNTGTKPSPILGLSGRQFFEGSSMRATEWVINTAPSLAAITTPLTTVPWVNPYGMPVIVNIAPNGATWSGSTPILVNATTMKAPNGSGSNNTAWNSWTASNGAVNVCVQAGGSITLAYTGGPPTMVASLAFFMWNVDPGALGSGFRNMGFNAGSNAWARLLDFASDPNNGLCYTETTKPIALENIFTSGAGLTDVAVMLDTCEGGSMINCDIQGGTSIPSLSWVVPNGQLQIVGSFVTAAILGGQVVNLVGTAFQNNSNATNGIQLRPTSSGNVTTVFPLNVNSYGAYFNGGIVAGTLSTCWDNQNAATTTCISVYGGEWLVSAGAAPAGYIINNIATTTINTYGSITFRKLTNNPMPLTASAPAGFAQNGNLQFLGAETQAAFLANSLVGWQISTPTALATVGSGNDYTNTLGIPLRIFITSLGGGSITAYGITDPAGTLKSFTPGVAANINIGSYFDVDVGGKIRFTFSGTPVWLFYGRQA